MQTTGHPEGNLPHQESRRIIDDLFPERVSIDDDFRAVYEAISGIAADNENNTSTVRDYQADTDGIIGSRFTERESSDALRDDALRQESNRALRHGRRRVTVPGGARYSGSSETIGNEWRYAWQAHQDAIQDAEEQDPANRPSVGLSHDIEKGKTGPKERDETNQDSGYGGQTQWENNVVGWDGPNDPQNPQNWKKSKKYIVTVFYASLTFCITFSSSVFSTATQVTAKQYGVSNEVMTLGTSLFVLVSARSQLHASCTNTNTRVSPSVQ